jgi:hypothetical protein
MDASYRDVVGMTLGEARDFLAGLGLRAVVSRQDDQIVSDADLTTPGAVLLFVLGKRVVGIEGRTDAPVTGPGACDSESGPR